ncbi:hypothetical protein [Mesorhizobium sp. M0244]|uniref:hypothetical protein n=1 Tax=Mesorhizobium sp. M0244 TaxID=2956926 RepID=UPI003338153B
MTMMKAEAMFLTSIFQKLGQRAPTEDELKTAVQEAFVAVKKDQGIDPDKVKLHFNLVPISQDWVDETFK